MPGRGRRTGGILLSHSPEEKDRLDLLRDWKLFTALTFLYSFGFAVYNGVYQNFLRDDLAIQPLQAGSLESFREIPGLLAALLAGTLVALAEARVAVLGLAVMGIGIAITGRFLQFWPQVAVSVLWSVGFHVWATVSPAITLTLAKGAEGGRHLGRMAAVGGIGNLVALGLAFGVAKWVHLPYEAYFVAGGVAILTGAGLGLRLSHHASGSKRRERFLWRREYGLYYWLTFLDGCRRQVVGTFAALTLILVYKVPLETMLGLQLVSTVAAIVAAPRVGRLFDRVGERTPLTWYAVLLVVIFLGYALIPNREVLCFLFVVDRVAFTFGVGFNTFLHRIVRPGEFTPSAAMGVTMNHVAAVTVPVLGAWLWQSQKAYQLPFVIGIGVALLSLWATRKIPDRPAEPTA